MNYANPTSEHGEAMCMFCRREPSEIVDLVEGTWRDFDGDEADVVACETCVSAFTELFDYLSGSDCGVCAASRDGQRPAVLTFDLQRRTLDALTCADCRDRAIRVRVEDTRPPAWLAALPSRTTERAAP